MDFATAVPDSAMVRCIMTMRRKYPHRCRDLKKSLQESAAETEIETSTNSIVHPGNIEDEWTIYFQKAQQEKKVAFHRHGEKLPRDVTEERVSNITGQQRIDFLFKQAELSAARATEKKEALRNVCSLITFRLFQPILPGLSRRLLLVQEITCKLRLCPSE